LSKKIGVVQLAVVHFGQKRAVVQICAPIEIYHDSIIENKEKLLLYKRHFQNSGYSDRPDLPDRLQKQSGNKQSDKRSFHSQYSLQSRMQQYRRFQFRSLSHQVEYSHHMENKMRSSMNKFDT